MNGLSKILSSTYRNCATFVKGRMAYVSRRKFVVRRYKKEGSRMV